LPPTSESWLRLSGLTALIAAMAVGVPYRLRAHRAGGAVPRRDEGLALAIGLRGFAALWGLGFVLWLIDPGLMRWAEVPLPMPLRWLGAVLLFLTVPLYRWVFHHLGLNLTDTVRARNEATLVRTGPYRWIRHPLYSFGALFVAGWALLTANLWVAATSAIAAALIVRRTAIEERFLIERFGDAYRSYAAATGRFFPRVGGRA
jgi:protein-S-isoprenylcysteine O-methyltransferase Ste14